jgi:hypothetical protein
MTRIIEDARSITARTAASVLPPCAQTGRVTIEIAGKYAQEITVISTPSNIEGLIRWFVCPACQKRVGKLYLPFGEAVLLCRKCHGLAYRAQQVRAFRRPNRASTGRREEHLREDMS